MNFLGFSLFQQAFGQSAIGQKTQLKASRNRTRRLHLFGHQSQRRSHHLLSGSFDQFLLNRRRYSERGCRVTAQLHRPGLNQIIPTNLISL